MNLSDENKRSGASTWLSQFRPEHDDDPPLLVEEALRSFTMLNKY